MRPPPELEVIVLREVAVELCEHGVQRAWTLDQAEVEGRLARERDRRDHAE